MEPAIHVVRDEAEMVGRAAAIILGLWKGPLEHLRGEDATEKVIALSGGNTPRALYRHLGREHPELQAARVKDEQAEVPSSGPGFLYSHIFWSDERCVPHTDPRSNYALAREELLAPLDFRTEQIHPMPGEVEDGDTAAASYERDLRRLFSRLWVEKQRARSLLQGDSGATDELPAEPTDWSRFDLVLLGIGADGHTASLFPGSPVLEETERWVAPAAHPETGEPRLTLTLPCINRARHVLFIARGKAKAGAVRGALEPDDGAPLPPAARVQPAGGDCTWILDEAAAAGLTRRA